MNKRERCRRVIVSLSGGIDSAVTLAEAIQRGREVRAVSFSYPSKHNEFELNAACNIAKHYEVPFQIVNAQGVMESFKSNLLKSGGDIPEGHYQEESMRQTVVPSRNIIFMSILAGLAESLDYSEVWFGIHAGDHFIYPDCRPDFFVSMNKAVVLGTAGKVLLFAPYLYDEKGQVVNRGLELHVPFELTRTCYKQQEIACGKCGSCQERIESFKENKTIDPIEYENKELLWNN